MEVFHFGQECCARNGPDICIPLSPQQWGQCASDVVRRSRANQVNGRRSRTASADSSAAEGTIQFQPPLDTDLVGSLPGIRLLPNLAWRVFQSTLDSFALGQIQQRT